MSGVVSVALSAQFLPKKDDDDVDEVNADDAGGYGGYGYGADDGSGGCCCGARRVVGGPVARLRFQARL